MYWLPLVACFLIRATPRLLAVGAVNFDTQFHLYMARFYAANRFRIPQRVSRIVVPHRLCYPPLYHFLLGLVPARARPWAERLTGAVVDTAILGLIYASCGRTLGGFSDPMLPWIGWLYAIAPALLRIGPGPRAFSGSPRLLGQLVYTAHLLLFWHGWQESSALAIAGSIGCGALIPLTSKFAMQVLVFFGVFLTIFVTPWYAAVLLGSQIVAFVLTRGHAWRIVRGQVLHSLFYRRHVQQLNLAPFFPPLKVYLRQLASVGYHLVIRRNLDWPLRWHAAEGNHFVHMFLFFYPQVLVALSVWFDQPGPWQRLLLVWLTAATVCYVLTRLRPLLFLGESERYLEYAMLPALYLTVEKLWGSPRLWALAIWFGVNTFIVLIAYVVQARKQHRQAIALQRGYEALDDLPEGTVLPLGHWNWPLLANTRHPIVHAFGFDENYVPLAEFRVLRGKFPFPGDLSEVVRRYDVKYIVADRGTVDHYLEHVTDDAGELERLATRVYDDQLVVFATKD